VGKMNKDYALQIFNYLDGNLYWKEKTSKYSNIKIGQLVGFLDAENYRRVVVNKKSYGVHQIVYLIFHGFIPNEIDHKDGNPLNNCIENLREATRFQQGCNTKINKNNNSGVKGVYLNKQLKRYVVRLSVNGKRKSFGTYKDIDYAKFISESMRYKYHKEFGREK
jgi:hypothetical protein